MADGFKYDVFLSHSSLDKVVVRDAAERLRGDGLRVWLDEWSMRIRRAGIGGRHILAFATR